MEFVRRVGPKERLLRSGKLSTTPLCIIRGRCNACLRLRGIVLIKGPSFCSSEAGFDNAGIFTGCVLCGSRGILLIEVLSSASVSGLSLAFFYGEETSQSWRQVRCDRVAINQEAVDGTVFFFQDFVCRHADKIFSRCLFSRRGVSSVILVWLC